MNEFSDTDTAVLIVSQRQRPDGFGRQPGYVAFIEAEDVLAAGSDADLVMVDHGPKHPLIRARRFGGRQIRRFSDSTRPIPSPFARRGNLPLPLRGKVSLPRRHYDVAVFVGFTVWDLPLLERLAGVLERVDRVVAWFPEAWASEFDDGRVRYEAFGILDTIFVGMETAASELAAVVSCPVHHLPPAVDVLRFAGLVPDETRPIDVLGIGRREPRLHRALLDWSRKSNKLYVYDTMSGTTVPDAPAHRENLGDTYRRSDIAITNFAKYDAPEITEGDREIPGRLWEALAGGSLMIGIPPDERLQREQVGDIVVTEIPSEPSEAVELIEELQLRDHRDLRRSHVQLALRRHDWAHRWQTIFSQSDLTPPAGIQARVDRLAGMADSIEGVGRL